MSIDKYKKFIFPTHRWWPTSEFIFGQSNRSSFLKEDKPLAMYSKPNMPFKELIRPGDSKPHKKSLFYTKRYHRESVDAKVAGTSNKETKTVYIDKSDGVDFRSAREKQKEKEILLRKQEKKEKKRRKKEKKSRKNRDRSESESSDSEEDEIISDYDYGPESDSDVEESKEVLRKRIAIPRSTVVPY